MPEEKSDRYIKIARACLRAINDVSRNNASRDQSVKTVYEAIENAFAEEMADYRGEIDVMESVLERIASGNLSPDAMRQLARKALQDRKHWEGTGASLH